MMYLSGRSAALVLALGAAALFLSGCSSKGGNNAPVEDRVSGVPAPAPAPTGSDASVSAQRQFPGSENAGKPGYYTVKPGDTLIRIGLETGQGWRDIARWNALENPNLIEVGQVLRVVPPQAGAVAVASVVARPVTSAAVAPTAAVPAQSASGASLASSSAASTPVAAVSAPVPASPVAGTGGDDELAWIWPARGSVLTGFDETKNKGLDIGGAAGDAVLAAADGRVVYVGASLRGYGNLIILKHNNTYLTAYAHNQVLLVKEDQSVRKGQKIAEMGSSDADRVKLHFEVRRQGKPVDPAKYLPPR